MGSRLQGLGGSRALSLKTGLGLQGGPGGGGGGIHHVEQDTGLKCRSCSEK